jgi:hypothetical protein
VEASNHIYVGVDWKCAACETPNSRAADFCVNCGNPREGNVDVQRLADQPRGPQLPPVRRPLTAMSAGRSKAPFVIGGIVVAVVAFILVAIFWQRDVVVVVERHEWTREIDVERMAARSQSSWCDSMPSDAYSVSRSREVRSHRQIPDGQTCSDRNVDNGDGTFSVKTTCTTKYRSEPIYDDKCYYTVNRWGVDRTERATGIGLVPGPSWPYVGGLSGGSCLGCTREGSRRERLELALRDTKKAKDTWRCTVEDARWRRLTDGSQAPMRVRVITGGAVCSTLRPT